MKESSISIKLADFVVPSVVYEFSERPVPAHAPAPAPAVPAPFPCGSDHYYDSSYAVDGKVDLRMFKISEVPAEDLLEMCEKFKEDVFRIAGKSDYLLSKTGVGR